MKKFTAVLVAVVFALSVFAPSAMAVERLIFANISLESGIQAAEVFKEVAERESNGTLEIQLFHNNVLGDDRTAVETTHFGDIDIAVSSTSPVATIINDFFMFDAPFLFFDEEAADSVLLGPVGQEILDNMQERGFKGLAFWENGFRHFTSNSIPVRTPADASGVTVRTMENEIHLAIWRAFGANPTPMAMTEVFTALQQGTIDAQENTIGTIDGFGLAEIQRYISLTGHVYTPFIVLMNLDRFNGLNEVQQQAILRASEASTAFQREFARNFDSTTMAAWPGMGVTIVTLTDEEKAAFQQLGMDAGIFDTIRTRMNNPQFLDQTLEYLATR